MRTAAASDPDALRPPPGNPRFPLLDGLRAAAALSVVVTHAAGLSGFNVENPLGAYTARMNIGVTIFFLLSGFLLYRPFVRAALHRVEPPRVRRYFRRRALRIVPAYWLALTVLAATTGLAGVFTGDWWIYYGLLQVYTQATILGGIGPAWSLCIEASFYLALPFFALAIRSAYERDPRRGLRIDALALAVLALVAVAARTAVHVADDSTVLPFTLPGTFLWFALGMLLAVASVALEGAEERVAPVRAVMARPWIAWAVAALVFWLTSTQAGLPREGAAYTSWTFFLEYVLYGVVAFFLLLPAIFGDDRGGWPRRILANRVVAWLGLVSYGIYLWHVSLMIELYERGALEWVRGTEFLGLLAMSVAAATTCAALSYYLVERPLLRFKDPSSAGSAVALGRRLRAARRPS